MKRKADPKRYKTMGVEWANRDGSISSAKAELLIDPIEIMLQLVRKAATNKGLQATALRGAIVVKADLQ